MFSLGRWKTGRCHILEESLVERSQGEIPMPPGYLYGGQVGVRFPVARGFSVDMGLQYIRLEIDFKGKSDLSEQWLFTTGVRF